MRLEISLKRPHLLPILWAAIGTLIVLVVNLLWGQVDHISEIFKINTLVQRVPFPESYLKKIDNYDDHDSNDDNTTWVYWSKSLGVVFHLLLITTHMAGAITSPLLEEETEAQRGR